VREREREREKERERVIERCREEGKEIKVGQVR
jgi:hypothetical protein